MASIDPIVRDFDPEAVASLLERLPSPSPETISPRLGEISRRLLGRPYRVEALGGGPDEVEVLSVSVSGFDCVTYMEHVAALAMSASPGEFPGFVRRLRYRGGNVTWKERNHYMTSWAANNRRARLVRPLAVPNAAKTVVRTRRLDVVAGFAPRNVDVRSLPKREFLENGPHLETGDLVFFVSTRRHLDVFHCGVVIVDESGEAPTRLRHAARSRGEVVEQTLESFVSANRMAGIFAVRPIAA